MTTRTSIISHSFTVNAYIHACIHIQVENVRYEGIGGYHIYYIYRYPPYSRTPQLFLFSVAVDSKFIRVQLPIFIPLGKLRNKLLVKIRRYGEVGLVMQ